MSSLSTGEAPDREVRAAAVAATSPAVPSTAGRNDMVATLRHLQRTVGNRAVAAVAHRTGRRLARYKILGPFNIGQAVHETLTLLAVDQAIRALKAAGKDPGDLLKGFDSAKVPKLDDAHGHEFDPEYADVSHQQFIRGVVWADDPRGQLFDEDEGTGNYSSGRNWHSEFSDGEQGTFAKDKSDLIARSHFGDLQFFHGMASADGEAAATTKQHMLTWARFLVDVAAGRTSHSSKVKDVPGVSGLFPANADWTIAKLFGHRKGSSVQIRQRAVGVLFHLIQDSHAHGHVDRDVTSGAILEFHAYGGQDDKEHGKFDAFGPGKDLAERIKNTIGASSAVDRCAEVLVLIAGGTSTDDIVAHLDTVVFKLDSGVRVAGAGAGLAKKVKPAPPPPSPLAPPRMHPGKI